MNSTQPQPQTNQLSTNQPRNTFNESCTATYVSMVTEAIILWCAYTNSTEWLLFFHGSYNCYLQIPKDWFLFVVVILVVAGDFLIILIGIAIPSSRFISARIPDEQHPVSYVSSVMHAPLIYNSEQFRRMGSHTATLCMYAWTMIQSCGLSSRTRTRDSCSW